MSWGDRSAGATNFENPHASYGWMSERCGRGWCLSQDFRLLKISIWTAWPADPQISTCPRLESFRKQPGAKYMAKDLFHISLIHHSYFRILSTCCLGRVYKSGLILAASSRFTKYVEKKRGEANPKTYLANPCSILGNVSSWGLEFGNKRLLELIIKNKESICDH